MIYQLIQLEPPSTTIGFASLDVDDVVVVVVDDVDGVECTGVVVDCDSGATYGVV